MKKDFAEIEREAEMADQIKSRRQVEEEEVKKSAEDNEKAELSMRLAYQDLSAQQKKTVRLSLNKRGVNAKSFKSYTLRSLNQLR